MLREFGNELLPTLVPCPRIIRDSLKNVFVCHLGFLFS
jgi:hypothetical protein